MVHTNVKIIEELQSFLKAVLDDPEIKKFSLPILQTFQEKENYH